MIRALTADQMRDAEERAVAEVGVTLAGLMQHAGTAVGEHVLERLPGARVAVVAGSGNNGGDGWVAARTLAAAELDVHVLTPFDPGELSGSAAAAAREAIAADVEWSQREAIAVHDLDSFDVIIDGLLGIGGVGPVRENLVPWVEAINDAPCWVVAVDTPSGVDADTGAVPGAAVRADTTVTFSAPKVGLLLFPGAGYAGEIVVADVGVPDDLLAPPGAPEVWPEAVYASRVPLPAPGTHKNERGRLLVVAGSGAYPGAAVLAVQGAQRMGAGYVTLAVPESVVPIVQGHLVSSPVVGLPESRGKVFAARALDAALDIARDYDAVVVGPGLTLADGAAAMGRGLAAQLDRPLVIDADGLNALMDATEILHARAAPTVITPHPGELSRLLGTSVSDIQADRLSAAQRLAGGLVTCVLKGAGTVTAGDGRVVINTSGTPALATSGTGDVLAGMVGALLAQDLDTLSAAAVGAYVHGRAGEAAAADLTPVAVTSTDVPRYIPVAVGELLGSW